MKFSLAIFLIALSGNAHGNEAPDFAILVSVKEESTLKMNCGGSSENPGYLACNFVQKSIVRPERNNAEDEVLFSKAKNDDKIKKDFILKLKEECQKKQDLKSVNESQSKYINEMKNLLTESCACLKGGSFECVKGYINGVSALASRTCDIQVNDFKLEFKKIGKDRYVTDARPHGICSVVNIVVLERDVKSKLWKFTQTRVSAESTPNCKFLELNKPSTFLENYSVEFPGCDFISLGA